MALVWTLDCFVGFYLTGCAAELAHRALALAAAVEIGVGVALGSTNSTSTAA